MILGYYEDGPNLVSMAMNGWGAAEPAWWLNLQADPHAVVELAGGIRREVLGRPAVGEERERLWRALGSGASELLIARTVPHWLFHPSPPRLDAAGCGRVVPKRPPALHLY